ncbi:MAG: hypothetical protein ABMA14_16800 [Hyphomonadaceae bacterium]
MNTSPAYIFQEWDSYRGKTVQAPAGVTLNKLDIAHRAYSAAERQCEAIQDCVNTLEALTLDEEAFRYQTEYSLQCGIVVARLKAALFQMLGLAYQNQKYELGLETPNVASRLGAIAFSLSSTIQNEANVPLNDNTKNGIPKKQRRKKAGKVG